MTLADDSNGVKRGPERTYTLNTAQMENGRKSQVRGRYQRRMRARRAVASRAMASLGQRLAKSMYDERRNKERR